jgi:hypothetical protein
VGYEITEIPVTLIAQQTSTTPFKLAVIETTKYGFKVDYVGPKPLYMYYIAFPVNLYREFLEPFIKTKFDNATTRTDNYYYIGYTRLEGVSLKGIDCFVTQLMASQSYKLKVYYTYLGSTATDGNLD